MKLISIVLSFTLLFTCCYTPTVVTKDTPHSDNKELVFKLLWIKNGAIKEIYHPGESYVISQIGQHHRIENGYEVKGTHVTSVNFSKEFSGILYDDQIKEVVVSVNEYDATATMALIGVGVLVGVAIVISAVQIPPLR